MHISYDDDYKTPSSDDVGGGTGTPAEKRIPADFLLVPRPSSDMQLDIQEDFDLETQSSAPGMSEEAVEDISLTSDGLIEETVPNDVVAYEDISSDYDHVDDEENVFDEEYVADSTYENNDEAVSEYGEGQLPAAEVVEPAGLIEQACPSTVHEIPKPPREMADDIAERDECDQFVILSPSDELETVSASLPLEDNTNSGFEDGVDLGADNGNDTSPAAEPLPGGGDGAGSESPRNVVVSAARWHYIPSASKATSLSGQASSPTPETTPEPPQLEQDAEEVGRRGKEQDDAINSSGCFARPRNQAAWISCPKESRPAKSESGVVSKMPVPATMTRNEGNAKPASMLPKIAIGAVVLLVILVIVWSMLYACGFFSQKDDLAPYAAEAPSAAMEENEMAETEEAEQVESPNAEAAEAAEPEMEYDDSAPDPSGPALEEAKSALWDAVNRANTMNLSGYTENSVSDYRAAVEAARDVCESPYATAQQVASALHDLKAAEKALAEPSSSSVRGAGDDTIDIPQGYAGGIIHVKHSGAGAFSVRSVDEAGEPIEVLIETVGSYNGIVTCLLGSRPASAISIEANGTWEIKFTKSDAMPLLGNGENVTGDYVAGLWNSDEIGQLTFECAAAMKVFAVAPDGRVAVLVDANSPGRSEAPNSSYTMLVIKTSGTWSISW